MSNKIPYTSDIPTKVSELENDAGYMTNVSHTHEISEIENLQETIDRKVDKDENKTLSTNDFTNELKNKLNGIENGAQKNQKAFFEVIVGDTSIQSDKPMDALELKGGTNVNLTIDENNAIVINAAGGGAGGQQVQADWEQSDVSRMDYIKNKPDEFQPKAHTHDVQDVTGLESRLQNIESDINEKINESEVSQVGKSGSYNDLNDKPDLSVYAEKNKLATVATTGNYNDLSNKPEIPAAQMNADWNAADGVTQILNKPTKVSQFENDADYASSSDIDSKADKVGAAVEGNFAGLDSNGNLTDSGKKASDFATANQVSNLENAKVDKEDGKHLSTNDFTNDYKTKLEEIQSGAEVNQNSFSGVKVGSTNISATSKTDTIELVGGSNISLSVDSENKKITITGNIPEVQQADWGENDSTKASYVNNKPEAFPPTEHNHGISEITGLENQIGDINREIAKKTNDDELSSVAKSGSYNDLNDKPDLSVYARNNALSNVATSGDYNDLRNKPNIPAAQINSDWNATSGLTQILNKPELGTSAAKDVPSSGNASASQVVMGNDSRLTDAREPIEHTHRKIEFNNQGLSANLTISDEGTLALTRIVTNSGVETLNISTNWKYYQCEVIPAQNFSFSCSTDGTGADVWNNNILFRIWGNIAYIWGSFKCSNAISIGNKLHCGTVYVPSGFTLLGATCGTDTLGVQVAISGAGSIWIYAIESIPANTLIHIRAFMAIEPILTNTNNTLIQFSDGTVRSFPNITTLNRQSMIDNGIYASNAWVNIPTRVWVGNTVTSISDAFKDCQELVYVSIPETVTTIDSNAFKNCSCIMNFEVSEDNQVFKSVNGQLLSKDGTELVAGTGSYVVVPNGVTTIRTCAFNGRTNLCQITLLDSVTLIDEAAFENCTNLTTVNFGLGIEKIGNYAFLGCSNLTWISLPDSVKYIDNCAFMNCSGLTAISIGRGIRTIGQFAFSGCTAVTDFTMLNEAQGNELGQITPNDIVVHGEAFGNGDNDHWYMGSLNRAQANRFHVAPLTNGYYETGTIWGDIVCNSSKCNFELWRDAPTARNIPAWDACTKSTNWNGEKAQTRYMNNLSPYLTFDDSNDPKISFVDRTQVALDRGCNYVAYFVSNYLDDSNEPDGIKECHSAQGKTGYSPYGSSSGFANMNLVPAVVDEMSQRLKYANDNNLGIVLFLIADDSTTWFDKLTEKTNGEYANWRKYCCDLKKIGWFNIASTVVLGLEVEEYGTSVDWNALTNITREYYSGTIAVHHGGGYDPVNQSFSDRTLGEGSTDVSFVQVEPGCSQNEIQSYISRAYNLLRKPLCMFEMERHPNRSLSEYALSLDHVYSVGNW